MASTDGAPVPGEGEQKPEDTDDKKGPGQSEEPVSVAPQVPGTDQHLHKFTIGTKNACLLYTSPSPRDLSTSRMPSSA